MAADRSRLAAALAYRQAEEERRRRMMESVPGLVTDPAQPAPRADFRTNLENLSIGLGKGLTNQLEGVKSIITDPVGTAKGVYEAGKAFIRDPSVIADALRYTAEKATSGPLGAGEVIGEMLGPRKSGPVMQELDVYHGTPHRFPATEANPLGEFDASKIGTGEGAQAYGHGTYLAESPVVAKSYKTALQGGPLGVDVMNAVQKALGVAYDEAASSSAFIDGVRKVAGQGEDAVRSAILKTSERMAKSKWPGEQRLADRVRLLANNPSVIKAINEDAAGALYKADLPDEMIDRMLDWDKPLSEQSEAIKRAMGNRYENWKNATGQDLYEALSEGLGGDKETSNWLRENGIPGIRYLDAGSRGQGGSGTRNFVVFPGEEKKVRILERK